MPVTCWPSLAVKPVFDARTIMAVCVADEAGNQHHDGRVAVARVILNRMRLKFQSDGTAIGTVLAKDQFSGFYFAMVGGKYTRVCSDRAGAELRAERKLAMYRANITLWTDCLRAVDEAMAMPTGAVGPGGITDKTVNYYNPAIVPKPPAWATPAKQDAVIQDHTFYHA